MRWVFLALILLGCRSEHTPLEDHVYQVTADAWTETLPQPPERGTYCRLESFRIEEPTDPARYVETCWGSPSWACLKWRYEAPRARSILYPAAVLNPAAVGDTRARLAVHELVHAFCLCTFRDSDSAHTRANVWRPNPDSVEARAVADL